MSKQEQEESDGTEAKDPNIDFLHEQSESIVNHLVRQDPDLKGVVNIEVNTDGTYDIVLHRGSQNRARTIESVSKDKLIEMIKQNL